MRLTPAIGPLTMLGGVTSRIGDRCRSVPPFAERSSFRYPQGPVTGDSASVPTQQGLWCDEPANSLRSGQARRDSTKQAPVLVGQLRSVVAAVQHAELVP